MGNGNKKDSNSEEGEDIYPDICFDMGIVI